MFAITTWFPVAKRKRKLVVNEIAPMTKAEFEEQGQYIYRTMPWNNPEAVDFIRHLETTHQMPESVAKTMIASGILVRQMMADGIHPSDDLKEAYEAIQTMTGI